MNNATLSASFHAQFFYLIGKKVLSAFSDLHESVTRQKGMDYAEPVSSGELLSFVLENMAKPMF